MNSLNLLAKAKLLSPTLTRDGSEDSVTTHPDLSSPSLPPSIFRSFVEEPARLARGKIQRGSLEEAVGRTVPRLLTHELRPRFDTYPFYWPAISVTSAIIPCPLRMVVADFHLTPRARLRLLRTPNVTGCRTDSAAPVKQDTGGGGSDRVFSEDIYYISAYPFFTTAFPPRAYLTSTQPNIFLITVRKPFWSTRGICVPYRPCNIQRGESSGLEVNETANDTSKPSLLSSMTTVPQLSACGSAGEDFQWRPRRDRSLSLPPASAPSLGASSSVSLFTQSEDQREKLQMARRDAAKCTVRRHGNLIQKSLPRPLPQLETFILCEEKTLGAAVAERLDCSPPTKANRVRSPAGSLPDFRKWKSCRTMPLVGGVFLGDLPFPPPLYSRAASFSPHFTLIGSQDLVVNSRPNLSTHLLGHICALLQEIHSHFKLLLINQVLALLRSRNVGHILQLKRSVNVYSEILSAQNASSVTIGLHIRDCGCDWRVCSTASESLRRPSTVLQRAPWIAVFSGHDCFRRSDQVRSSTSPVFGRPTLFDPPASLSSLTRYHILYARPCQRLLSDQHKMDHRNFADKNDYM
ncbi:hypothetical protein PR048_018476 [Dryococelus australis]|uniref:Uncharacterized protein n=1 Tax=Dryococelus australis TaxID=614101 RepID=A0ABQ9HCF6_9NEOP|nr:hypothetical protein PR048_018476 [Dryococelus australis]